MRERYRCINWILFLEACEIIAGPGKIHMLATDNAPPGWKPQGALETSVKATPLFTPDVPLPDMSDIERQLWDGADAPDLEKATDLLQIEPVIDVPTNNPIEPEPPRDFVQDAKARVAASTKLEDDNEDDKIENAPSSQTTAEVSDVELSPESEAAGLVWKAIGTLASNVDGSIDIDPGPADNMGFHPLESASDDVSEMG